MPFFTFDQNNSGGAFHIDTDVSHYVIIEAKTAEQANRRAEQIGIYFDGVTDGMDRDCCGDRWNRVYTQRDGTEKPSIYGQSVFSVERSGWVSANQPWCHIYYANGKKKSLVK